MKKFLMCHQAEMTACCSTAFRFSLSLTRFQEIQAQLDSHHNNNHEGK
jgi:hypothetical protein